MKTPKCLLSCLTALSLAQTASASTVIAVPGAVGDSSNVFPFGGAGPGASLRYQQVYGASAFSAIDQGGLITALGFNLTSPQDIGGILPDVQIDFSTTPRPVDGLSTTFAANVGADDTIVHARGQLEIQPHTPGAPPGFGVLVILDTPFLYNPAAGNLLMDVRRYDLGSGGSAPGLFNAANDLGDSVSRVSAFNVADASGLADTFGLVTGFVVTPVPEPGSGVLSFFGVATLGIFLRWRQRKLGNRRKVRATTN